MITQLTYQTYRLCELLQVCLLRDVLYPNCVMRIEGPRMCRGQYVHTPDDKCDSHFYSARLNVMRGTHVASCIYNQIYFVSARVILFPNPQIRSICWLYVRWKEFRRRTR